MKNLLEIKSVQIDNRMHYFTEPRRLILLNDNEICVNDYYFNHKTESIQKRTEDTNDDSYDGYKKIIASYPKLDNLPTFSFIFTQEWLINQVNFVEVECDLIPNAIYVGVGTHLELKLTDNNEVICNIPNSNIKSNKNINTILQIETNAITEQHDNSLELF